MWFKDQEVFKLIRDKKFISQVRLGFLSFPIPGPTTSMITCSLEHRRIHRGKAGQGGRGGEVRVSTPHSQRALGTSWEGQVRVDGEATSPGNQ